MQPGNMTGFELEGYGGGRGGKWVYAWMWGDGWRFGMDKMFGIKNFFFNIFRFYIYIFGSTKTQHCFPFFLKGMNEKAKKKEGNW